MLKTNISYFWIGKMLMKSLGVKIQIVKFLPLELFFHNTNDTFNRCTCYACLTDIYSGFFVYIK